MPKNVSVAEFVLQCAQNLAGQCNQILKKFRKYKFLYILNCVFTTFTGSYSNRVDNVVNKNFAITDFICLCIISYNFDNLFNHIVINNYFNFRFCQKIHVILNSSVNLDEPFLSSESFN